jgi:hypothetical protein
MKKGKPVIKVLKSKNRMKRHLGLASSSRPRPAAAAATPPPLRRSTRVKKPNAFIYGGKKGR